MSNASPLRYHRREEYYSCAGCGEQIEVPHALQGMPEELLEWLETQESNHLRCIESRVLSWPPGANGSAYRTA